VEADYVVVGAGAAGCVLAERLSRDPSVSVLVIEHGGPVRNPLLRVPKSFYAAMRRARYTHRYPVRLGGSGSETWVRGKALGGSTVINGLLYVRGDPVDYDELAAEGNPGWGWADLLPVFLAMEDHALGASARRGVGGPLHVSVTDADDEVLDAIQEAAAGLGIPQVEDLNAAVGARIGYTPVTIRNGVRVDAAGAFLAPATRRPNVVVADRTRAGHLLFDGDRVVGVRARRRGQLIDISARREVVLAAGALESPLLLERSGIGRPEVLRRAGVPVRRESPRVGEGLVEQRSITVKARLRPGLGLGPRLGTRAKRLLAAGRYLVDRRWPVGAGAYELAALIAAGGSATPGGSAAQHSDRPDTQLLFRPLTTDDTGLGIAPHAGLLAQGYALRPTTAGSVHISSAAPGSAPIVDARFLETEHDRQLAARILDRERELLATAPLAALVVEELAPGPGVSAPAAVAGYALATGAGIFHAVGSCAMGPTDEHVVDSRLRVRGVPGLRVVDASVFPRAPAGAMAAPVMAAAWRAAQLIAEEA
jgi:choline dehydrogenase-like flavoprotein